MKRIFCSIIVCLLLLSAISCSQENNVTEGTNVTKDTNITDVVFSTSVVNVKAEETVALVYDVFPVGSDSEKLDWRSTDTNIATVDSSGVVYGISPGQTSISVSYDGVLLATCSVTVDKKSAYGQLTAREREFVDTVLKYIHQVKNPDTLQISAIVLDEEYRIWYVKASVSDPDGGNRFMGNYKLYDDDQWSFKGFSKLSNGDAGVIITPDSSYNVTLITDAIQEKIQ